MGSTENRIKTQVGEKQVIPALPVMFTFIKWTVQGELIHYTLFT